jgi:hypothetical protein
VCAWNWGPRAFLKACRIALAVAGCTGVITVAAGCGGHSASRHATASVPAHRAAFIRPPASAVVALRRFSPKSLMWQSVFVRPDGSGVLTSLVGEISGAPQKPFRLSRAQVGTLQRLIATARTEKPPTGSNGDYIYSLHIAGRPAQGFGSPVPGPLGSLVNFLGGLMYTYCC